MVIRDTASACLGYSESVVRRPTFFWVVLLRWYVGCAHTHTTYELAWLCIRGGCLLASFRLVHVRERARVGKSPLICRRPVVMGRACGFNSNGLVESVKRGLELGALAVCRCLLAHVSF